MGSPILKTRATVLRVWPYSETSCVVAWLTADRGRITTMAKGAYRPRSIFAGAFDLFHTCELLYYARPEGSLHIARECSPLASRGIFRTDWRAMVAASYITDLAARALPSDAPLAGSHELLEAALDDAVAHGGRRTLVLWYELRLLALLGLAPRLDRCVSCDLLIGEGVREVRFSAERGGVLCADCGAGKGQPLAGRELALICRWQAAETPAPVRASRATVRQADVLWPLLGSFIAFHLDLDLRSRAIALELLTRPR